MKYKFVSYYKYCFELELEDGRIIVNEDQDHGGTYRLSIGAEGEAEEQDDGTFLVEGVLFVLVN